jgi:hypothetical protein
MDSSACSRREKYCHNGGMAFADCSAARSARVAPVGTIMPADGASAPGREGTMLGAEPRRAYEGT